MDRGRPYSYRSTGQMHGRSFNSEWNYDNRQDSHFAEENSYDSHFAEDNLYDRHYAVRNNDYYLNSCERAAPKFCNNDFNRRGSLPYPSDYCPNGYQRSRFGSDLSDDFDCYQSSARTHLSGEQSYGNYHQPWYDSRLSPVKHEPIYQNFEEYDRSFEETSDRRRRKKPKNVNYLRLKHFRTIEREKNLVTANIVTNNFTSDSSSKGKKVSCAKVNTGTKKILPLKKTSSQSNSSLVKSTSGVGAKVPSSFSASLDAFLRQERVKSDMKDAGKDPVVQESRSVGDILTHVEPTTSGVQDGPSSTKVSQSFASTKVSNSTDVKNEQLSHSNVILPPRCSTPTLDELPCNKQERIFELQTSPNLIDCTKQLAPSIDQKKVNGHHIKVKSGFRDSVSLDVKSSSKTIALAKSNSKDSVKVKPGPIATKSIQSNVRSDSVSSKIKSESRNTSSGNANSDSKDSSKSKVDARDSTSAIGEADSELSNGKSSSKATMLAKSKDSVKVKPDLIAAKSSQANAISNSVSSKVKSESRNTSSGNAKSDFKDSSNAKVDTRDSTSVIGEADSDLSNGKSNSKNTDSSNFKSGSSPLKIRSVSKDILKVKSSSQDLAKDQSNSKGAILANVKVVSSDSVSLNARDSESSNAKSETRTSLLEDTKSDDTDSLPTKAKSNSRDTLLAIVKSKQSTDKLDSGSRDSVSTKVKSNENCDSISTKRTGDCKNSVLPETHFNPIICIHKCDSLQESTLKPTILTKVKSDGQSKIHSALNQDKCKSISTKGKVNPKIATSAKFKSISNCSTKSTSKVTTLGNAKSVVRDSSSAKDQTHSKSSTIAKSESREPVSIESKSYSKNDSLTKSKLQSKDTTSVKTIINSRDPKSPKLEVCSRDSSSSKPKTTQINLKLKCSEAAGIDTKSEATKSSLANVKANSSNSTAVSSDDKSDSKGTAAVNMKDNSDSKDTTTVNIKDESDLKGASIVFMEEKSNPKGTTADTMKNKFDPTRTTVINMKEKSDPKSAIAVNMKDKSNSKCSIAVTMKDKSDPKNTTAVNIKEKSDPKNTTAVNIKEKSDPKSAIAVNMKDRPDPKSAITVNMKDQSNSKVSTTSNMKNKSDPKSAITVNMKDQSNSKVSTTSNMKNKSDPKSAITVNMKNKSDSKDSTGVNMIEKSNPKGSTVVNMKDNSDPKGSTAVNIKGNNNSRGSTAVNVKNKSDPKSASAVNMKDNSESKGSTVVNMKDNSNPKDSTAVNIKGNNNSRGSTAVNVKDKSDPKSASAVNMKNNSESKGSIAVNMKDKSDSKGSTVVNMKNKSDSKGSITVNMKDKSDPKCSNGVNMKHNSDAKGSTAVDMKDKPDPKSATTVNMKDKSDSKGSTAVNMKDKSDSKGSTVVNMKHNSDSKGSTAVDMKDKSDTKNAIAVNTNENSDCKSSTPVNLRRNSETKDSTAVDMKDKPDPKSTIAVNMKDKSDSKCSNAINMKHNSDFKGSIAVNMRDKSDTSAIAVNMKDKSDSKGSTAANIKGNSHSNCSNAVNIKDKSHSKCSNAVNMKGKSDPKSTVIVNMNDKSDTKGTITVNFKGKSNSKGVSAVNMKDKSDAKGSTAVNMKSKSNLKGTTAVNMNVKSDSKSMTAISMKDKSDSKLDIAFNMKDESQSKGAAAVNMKDQSSSKVITAVKSCSVISTSIKSGSSPAEVKKVDSISITVNPFVPTLGVNSVETRHVKIDDYAVDKTSLDLNAKDDNYKPEIKQKSLPNFDQSNPDIEELEKIQDYVDDLLKQGEFWTDSDVDSNYKAVLSSTSDDDFTRDIDDGRSSAATIEFPLLLHDTDSSSDLDASSSSEDKVDNTPQNEDMFHREKSHKRARMDGRGRRAKSFTASVYNNPPLIGLEYILVNSCNGRMKCTLCKGYPTTKTVMLINHINSQMHQQNYLMRHMEKCYDALDKGQNGYNLTLFCHYVIAFHGVRKFIRLPESEFKILINCPPAVCWNKLQKFHGDLFQPYEDMSFTDDFYFNSNTGQLLLMPRPLNVLQEYFKETAEKNYFELWFTLNNIEVGNSKKWSTAEISLLFKNYLSNQDNGFSRAKSDDKVSKKRKLCARSPNGQYQQRKKIKGDSKVAMMKSPKFQRCATSRKGRKRCSIRDVSTKFKGSENQKSMANKSNKSKGIAKETHKNPQNKTSVQVPPKQQEIVEEMKPLYNKKLNEMKKEPMMAPENLFSQELTLKEQEKNCSSTLNSVKELRDNNKIDSVLEKQNNVVNSNDLVKATPKSPSNMSVKNEINEQIPLKEQKGTHQHCLDSIQPENKLIDSVFEAEEEKIITSKQNQLKETEEEFSDQCVVKEEQTPIVKVSENAKDISKNVNLKPMEALTPKETIVKEPANPVNDKEAKTPQINSKELKKPADKAEKFANTSRQLEKLANVLKAAEISVNLAPGTEKSKDTLIGHDKPGSFMKEPFPKTSYMSEMAECSSKPAVEVKRKTSFINFKGTQHKSGGKKIKVDESRTSAGPKLHVIPQDEIENILKQQLMPDDECDTQIRQRSSNMSEIDDEDSDESIASNASSVSSMLEHEMSIIKMPLTEPTKIHHTNNNPHSILKPCEKNANAKSTLLPPALISDKEASQTRKRKIKFQDLPAESEISKISAPDTKRVKLDKTIKVRQEENIQSPDIIEDLKLRLAKGQESMSASSPVQETGDRKSASSSQNQTENSNSLNKITSEQRAKLRHQYRHHRWEEITNDPRLNISLIIENVQKKQRISQNQPFQDGEGTPTKLLKIDIPAICKGSHVYGELIHLSQKYLAKLKTPKLDDFNTLSSKLSAKTFFPKTSPKKVDVVQTVGNALHNAGFTNLTDEQLKAISKCVQDKKCDASVNEVDSTVDIPSPKTSEFDSLSSHPLVMQLRQTLNSYGMDCKWTKLPGSIGPNLLLTHKK